MTEETNVTTTPMQPVSLPKNKPNDALSILALFGDLTDIGLDPCEELPRVPAPMTKPQAAEQEMIWSLDDIRREEMLFERGFTGFARGHTLRLTGHRRHYTKLGRWPLCDRCRDRCR